MKDLREALAAQGVHTLLAQFTDIHGVAKGKWVPLAHLDALLTDGVGFSGPSIAGTGLPRMGARSEYHGRGLASTLRPLPWMPGFARIVCEGFVDAKPFEACPRQVLSRQVERLAKRGWTLQTGIEPEFFLLQQGSAGIAPADARDCLDKPSYDLRSLSRQQEFLSRLTAGLNGCGLDVLQVDHEDAHAQFEINFQHADVLTSADNLMLFKLAAHALAEQGGMLFSLMPKPFADQPGSGMHFHASLWEGAGEKMRCLFRDAAGHAASGGLSPLARQFVAGVLQHSAALCALAAPTVNSYKRLRVGETLSGTSWAPAHVAHGPNNRTALVRTLPGRFEWRLPDASTNPYLASAALIAAGLDGIERHLDPGPACTDDLFAMPAAEVQARGIAFLPQSLGAAVDALEANAPLREALGSALHGEFVRLKRGEHDDHARHVSTWELERYAARF